MFKYITLKKVAFSIVWQKPKSLLFWSIFFSKVKNVKPDEASKVVLKVNGLRFRKRFKYISLLSPLLGKKEREKHKLLYETHLFHSLERFINFSAPPMIINRISLLILLNFLACLYSPLWLELFYQTGYNSIE